jgi:hypothetical protein
MTAYLIFEDPEHGPAVVGIEDIAFGEIDLRGVVDRAPGRKDAGMIVFGESEQVRNLLS